MIRVRFASLLGLLAIFATLTAVAIAPPPLDEKTSNISIAEPNQVAAGLKVATFDIDATPPVGSMMAYDRVVRVAALGLRCRGIVITGTDKPIVLCAVDWIGIANESQDRFKATLAAAAGTTSDHVAVHTIHQHDAPRSDFSAEQIMHQAGLSDLGAMEGSVARDVLDRLKPAVIEAVTRAKPITHAGFANAVVKNVASNRRILGKDGKVTGVRFTACRDPKLRAEPVGTIDPEVSSLSFWNGDQPIAVLTYYACHPQSYYRTGVPSPDFPGIARLIREQDQPNTLHVHFAGAGGNVGAGKYNDGEPENRMILANRLADGMKLAFETSDRFPITAADVGWTTAPVHLPIAAHLDAAETRASISPDDAQQYWNSPSKLAWILRCQGDHAIDLGCLRVRDVRVLHMPGELFVEYQLAAKSMNPDLRVAMAAYGDYGPGYIGTKIAYGEGGYETSEAASNVSPDVEAVLMDGMHELLGTSGANE